MDELKRLIKIVAEQTGKTSPIIAQQDEGSLEKKLFHAIKNGAVTSDEEAAALMYGSSNNSANYRMLKSRLRKKVLNTFVFLKQPHSNKIKQCVQEMDECAVLLHQVQKLLNFGEYKAAQRIIDQVLTISIAAELTSFTVRVLEFQRIINMMLMDKIKFSATCLQLQKYYQLETAERSAEMLFYTSKLELTGSVRFRQQHFTRIPAILAELKESWIQTRISRIYNFYLSHTITWFELTGNYPEIFNVIEETENLLKQGKINPKWYNASFNNFIKTYAYIRTHQYEAGLVFAEAHWHEYNPKTFNWFAFMENYVQLALYAKKYELAIDLMETVTRNGYFNSLSKNKQERWELHRRYLLLVCEQIQIGRDSKFLKRELGTIKVLSADKEGANLAVIILRLVNNLFDGSYDDLGSQPELISKYISKYLRGEEAERVRSFLRLLLLVIKEEGKLDRISGKSQPVLEKLKKATKTDDAFAEFEIVPYEHLWELVLNQLQQKKR